MTSPVRILIADSHTIIRAGLQHLLGLEPGFEVVGEAADAQQVALLLRELAPDVLVIDGRLYDESVAQVLNHSEYTGKKCRVMILVAPSDRERISSAFRLGSHGFVMKDSAFRVLIQGIHNLVQGKYWISDKPLSCIDGFGYGLPNPARARSSSHFGLTKREMEVVRAVVAGFSNREIAARLKISQDTVKHHVTSIFDKVGVYNRLELALFAVHHGLTQATLGPKVRSDRPGRDELQLAK